MYTDRIAIEYLKAQKKGMGRRETNAKSIHEARGVELQEIPEKHFAKQISSERFT
jgi:hypothetical protein